ncbi:hypothetical protein BHE74_00058414, partial [Ensete ventricosum]
PQQSFATNYLDRDQQQIEHNSRRLLLHPAAALLRNSPELAMSSDAMLPHLELLPRLHRGADHDAKSLPKYDLKSTAHNRKKEQEEGIHMTPTAMMPSISMLALPEHDNVFIVGVDTSRVGIDITLMQDGPWHERGVSPKELQSMLMPAHAKKK